MTDAALPTSSPRANDFIIANPGGALQLMLLFHGVGASARSMAPVGQYLLEKFPNAYIVSVEADFPSTMNPQGRQWFSAQGVSDDNRWGRVMEAMPHFRRAIEYWQQQSGVTAHGTCLIGFSQGSIMALESTQIEPDLSSRVIAIAGRFAVLPQRVPPATTIHLLHGKQDTVIPYAHTVQAAEHWIELGADLTADILPFVGHELTPPVMDVVVQRLTTYIPKRLWDEAMRSIPR